MPLIQPAVTPSRVHQFERYSTFCAIGDSIIAGDGAFYNIMLYRSGGLYRSCGNFGVSGKRSDEILAAQVPQAIASGANYCVTQFGTNDIAQAVSEATLRTNAIAIWSALRNAGVEPIDISLMPTNTSGNVPRHVAHNIWRKLYCLRHGITHVDVWPLLATAAGAYTSGLNTDAIHPNTVGASLIADKLAARIAAPYQSDPLLALTDTKSDVDGAGKTFISNAVSFVDTNVDGVPDNWFAAGSGGTYSIQAADANDFGKWFRCAMTAGSAVGFTATADTLANLGWTAGNTLAVGCKYRWVDASQSLANTVQVTGITGANVQPAASVRGGASGSSGAFYTEITFTGGSSAGFSCTASGTGYIEVSRPIVVNLTALGV